MVYVCLWCMCVYGVCVCCPVQGRIFGDPMTMATLVNVTHGNITFLEGGLFVVDYESPYYAPPVSWVASTMGGETNDRCMGKWPFLY